jgi:adenylate kinase
MSKGVFINSIDTYFGQALYSDLLGEEEADKEFELFGTYFNKEVSERPKGVFKMLKMKEKPVLFRKYMLEKIDYFIYDLHSGKVTDLEWGIKALTKSPLESEKTVIVISSVLSWGGNPPRIVVDKPPEKEGEEVENEGDKVIDDKQIKQIEDSTDKANFTEENMNAEKVEKIENPPIDEIKMKRVGYNEEEFAQRIPSEEWANIKQIEDNLLNLKFENLNIYIICAGIPYGYSESVFNYFFKTAWLQDRSALPYFESGENLVPTIHIKDLAKIIKKILRGSKPETNYIFAVDQTTNKSLKNIISSISRGVGNGITESISVSQEFKLNFTSQDYFIDQSLLEKNNIELLITDSEYSWPKFLKNDIMLNPSKFIEDEFEWHCGSGIPGKIDLLLAEFCKMRKLRPIKIVLNCVDKNIRQKFANKISDFFNIPVINYEKIMEMLSLQRDTLEEEELYMKQKYLFLKERLQFLEENPDFQNEENLLLYEANEIMMEALKYLINENASRNRGYVLEGLPVNMEEVFRLYFKKEIIQDQEEEEIVNEEVNEEGILNDELNEEENSDKQEEGENVNEEKLAQNVKVPKKVVKKVKPKKYKNVFDKSLLPESVITICIDETNSDEVDNIFWEVENFYQENEIEILNLLYDNSIKSEEIKSEEIFEVMRIYIERVNFY